MIKKIREAGRYYTANKDVLYKFSKRRYLAYKDDVIEDNNTGLSDKELKSFLKNYNKTLILVNPIKEMMEEKGLRI